MIEWSYEQLAMKIAASRAALFDKIAAYVVEAIARRGEELDLADKHAAVETKIADAVADFNSAYRDRLQAHYPGILVNFGAAGRVLLDSFSLRIDCLNQAALERIVNHLLSLPKEPEPT